ncbi:primosome assembly protein PriA [Ornithinimicrobium panacihumi]|uniref:primosomal protein N' family DNA-binding protein n=1 Tax=Ornithinimicrobium panacihumi TaxID=2008449 RepID=UPI003F8CE3D5
MSAGEQLSLVPVPQPRSGTRSRRSGPVSDRPVAERDPIAKVLVDTGLAHLDRPFDYLVPADLDADARPGVRVRVRFAGRDHDGFLVERAAAAEHGGRLQPLRSVVSSEPVLTPPVLAAAELVAAHYGGSVGDVLRLAVPPRHARAERSVPPAPDGAVGPAPVEADVEGDQAGAAGPEKVRDAWATYPAGEAFLRRVAAGEAPAAAWTALPCQAPDNDWPAALAEAVAAARAGGRGAVCVLPDHRDVDRVVSAIEARLGEGSCVRLTADLGPEARYRAFVQLLRGHSRVAVGTRSAAWAPVTDVGLFFCWDDGDDLHQEPRAPYPHVRQILRARAETEGAALLLGGLVRSVTVQSWVSEGVVADVSPAQAPLRAAAPRVIVAGEGRADERDAAARTARLPSVALRALREGLRSGPVLVQVPRAGYLVSVACADCRTPARCPECHGPLGLSAGGSPPTCLWCTRTPPGPPGCRSCGSTRLRSRGVGEERTAEELGRAFPGTTVIRSGGPQVVAGVGSAPALVVATPGAEPVAEVGYRAVVLLDAWRLLDRPSLDAGVESLRRWCAAAGLACPGAEVVLCGAPPHAGIPAVESLVRWDPVGLAARELAERTSLSLPPVLRHVGVRGPEDAVQQVVAHLDAAGHRALGPQAAAPDGSCRAVIREGPAGELARSVREVRAGLSLRKAGEGVRMVLDAPDPLA